MEMLLTKIKNRGHLFSFSGTNSELGISTNVYLIEGEKFIYLCDTYISEKDIQPIKDYIGKNFPKKEIIVFNSHFHYDHIWGNSAFIGNKIISHKKCFELLSDNNIWNFMVKGIAKEQDKPIRTLPNITFSDELQFQKDGLLFFYSPGHSIDSSSCFDVIDKILFIGDNVEMPIPFLDWHNLDEYIKTLKKYTEINSEKIITSHNGLIENQQIEENIKYISDFKDNKSIDVNNKHISTVHEINKKAVLFSKYEEEARLRLGGNFDISKLFKIMNTYGKSELNLLENALKDYICRV